MGLNKNLSFPCIIVDFFAASWTRDRSRLGMTSELGSTRTICPYTIGLGVCVNGPQARYPTLINDMAIP